MVRVTAVVPKVPENVTLVKSNPAGVELRNL